MFRESEAADLGLAGRVALVTGGTRGVGRAVARRLCAAGCHVVLNYANSADQARRTVEELSGEAALTEFVNFYDRVYEPRSAHWPAMAGAPFCQCRCSQSYKTILKSSKKWKLRSVCVLCVLRVFVVKLSQIKTERVN